MVERMIGEIFSQFMVCLESLHFLKIGSKSEGKKIAKNIKEHIPTDSGFSSVMAVGWGWRGCLNNPALRLLIVIVTTYQGDFSGLEA